MGRRSDQQEGVQFTGVEIRCLEGNHCREAPPALLSAGAHHPDTGLTKQLGLQVLSTAVMCSAQQFWTCFMSSSVIFAARAASGKSGGAQDWRQLFASVIQLQFAEVRRCRGTMRNVKVVNQTLKRKLNRWQKVQVDKYYREKRRNVVIM